MKVGVPREVFPGESRVALIPSAVAGLKKAGLDVVVERDAGVKAGFTNAAYEHAGALIDEILFLSELESGKEVVALGHTNAAGRCGCEWML